VGQRRRTTATWPPRPDGGRPLGLTETAIRPAINRLTTSFRRAQTPKPCWSSSCRS